MEAALIGKPGPIEVVYGGGRRERLAAEFDLHPGILSADLLREQQGELEDVEILFSTWGMPALGRAQIEQLPSLRTLSRALWEEALVTIIIVLVMVMHLGSSALISATLPLAVLMCFAAMKLFGVDANIVALSGIAIAIGTIVDMGIVVTENILKHLDRASPDESRLEVVWRASSEVGGAVLTAILTTVVGFLPVFTMTGAEGKLFKPLAFTKTFVLLASVIVALVVIPPAAEVLFTWKIGRKTWRRVLYASVTALGLAVAVFSIWWAGLLVMLVGAYHLAKDRIPGRAKPYVLWTSTGVAVFAVLVLLSDHWLPLGADKGLLVNLVFVGLLIGGVLAFFRLFERAYAPILRWCLQHKLIFLSVPLALVVLGGLVWRSLGREFMPSLDEGSFLYMPTTMPHASIGEALDMLQKQDMAIHAIPEVETVVGKIGRAETPLDPAPVSMVETVINYSPEFIVDRDGRRVSFRYDPDGADFFRDELGTPLPADDGKPYLVRGHFVRDADGRLVPDSGGGGPSACGGPRSIPR